MLTLRQHLTALLADPLVFEAVVGESTEYAGRFDWRRGESADALVLALAKARVLRKAYAVALLACGSAHALRWLASWSVATESQARLGRHMAHVAMAAGPGEPSPVRLKPTEAERRQDESVQRWWS